MTEPETTEGFLWSKMCNAILCLPNNSPVTPLMKLIHCAINGAAEFGKPTDFNFCELAKKVGSHRNPVGKTVLQMLDLGLLTRSTDGHHYAAMVPTIIDGNDFSEIIKSSRKSRWVKFRDRPEDHADSGATTGCTCERRYDYMYREERSDRRPTGRRASGAHERAQFRTGRWLGI